MRNSATIRVFAKTSAGKILPINVHTYNTTEHLKQLIYQQTDTGDDMFEIDLTLEGKQLENGKPLSEYHIAPDVIVEVVTHEANDVVIPIVVISLADEPLTVYVKTSYTVTHLTQLISRLKNNAPIKVLLANRVILDYRKIISDYNIQKNDKIHMVLDIEGGGRILISRFIFGDVSKPFKIYQPLLTEPTHRQFCNGVSSEGLCANPECRLYGERFICQHGYGVYRVSEDPTKCPECQVTSPKVDSFGLSCANVIVRGMPLGLRTQEVEIRSDLEETEGNYMYVPYLVLKEHFVSREYEFIEVLSSTPDCPISLDWELCSLCYRTLVGSNVCNHGRKVN